MYVQEKIKEVTDRLYHPKPNHQHPSKDPEAPLQRTMLKGKSEKALSAMYERAMENKRITEMRKIQLK